MTGKEPNVIVNPDEVVAFGAAVQVCPYLVEINQSGLCRGPCAAYELSEWFNSGSVRSKPVYLMEYLLYRFFFFFFEIMNIN